MMRRNVLFPAIKVFLSFPESLVLAVLLGELFAHWGNPPESTGLLRHRKLYGKTRLIHDFFQMDLEGCRENKVVDTYQV